VSLQIPGDWEAGVGLGRSHSLLSPEGAGQGGVSHEQGTPVPSPWSRPKSRPRRPAGHPCTVPARPEIYLALRARSTPEERGDVWQDGSWPGPGKSPVGAVGSPPGPGKSPIGAVRSPLAAGRAGAPEGAEEARPSTPQRGSWSVGAAVGGRGGRPQPKGSRGSRGIAPLLSRSLTSSPLPPASSPTSTSSRWPGAEQGSFFSRTLTVGRCDSPGLGAVTEEGRGLDAGGALVIAGPRVVRTGSVRLADLGRTGSGHGPRGP
jgi:hypothetical protein